MNHLTGINHLSDDDIRSILVRAKNHADILRKGEKVERTLKRKNIITMFFENSTRTRLSFEMAANRLGVNVINWDAEHSSMKKNETFLDTVLTVGAMNPDAVIVRHSEYEAPVFMANRMRCSVINAGDSWREHPTQALLDAMTILEAKGTIEGLTITICGDVAHSRVAASNFLLLSRLGAKLRVIAPDFLMPHKWTVAGIETFTHMDEGLPGSDIIMMLRNQKERMNAAFIPDDITFHRQYGLTRERLDLAGKKALVMHPGPINRNVEIADDVADDPERSLILNQVSNGVPLRMAVLEHCIQGHAA
ncbi:MAG: aspartate carbamoyltransferase catalytic subunit [Micavibrio aeruginosavorus]|nr:aspartate carbamoyltransferase catalytic subunit [Micavibrio aeruginosavorus]